MQLGFSVVFILISTLCFLSNNKRMHQIGNYLLFLPITYLVIQKTFHSQDVPKEKLIALKYSTEKIFSFKVEDLEVKATKDSLFFSYQSLINGRAIKPSKSRFFTGEGLRFQLLRDNQVVEFTKIDRINDTLLCEFAHGSLTIHLELSQFCTGHKFHVNATDTASYRIIANAKMLNDLDVLEADSEIPTKMKPNEKYTDSVWTCMQIDSAILYMCGFKDTMIDGRFVFCNQAYQSSQDIKLSEAASFWIYRVPFVVKNIEQGCYGVTQGHKILNLWKGMWKVKIWILKAVEALMSLFGSPLLIIIFTSLAYKLFTMFDLLFFDKKRSAEGVVLFVTAIKFIIGVQLISIVANSGAFNNITVLWLKDPLYLGEDQFFAAVYTVSKNLIMIILSKLGRIGVIVATAILIPISLFMSRYTLIFFLDESKRLFASLHYKALILAFNIALLALVYRGCATLFDFSTIPDRLYNLLLYMPIYCSLSIYSYFLALNSKESSKRPDVQLVAEMAAPMLYFIFFNVLIPFLPISLYRSPLIVLGLSFNQLFDKLFDNLIKKYALR